MDLWVTSGSCGAYNHEVFNKIDDKILNSLVEKTLNEKLSSIPEISLDKYSETKISSNQNWSYVLLTEISECLFFL